MDLLSSIDLNMLDQISVLVWANSGDTALAEKLAGMRLLNDLRLKLNGDGKIDTLRNATILKICQYVKDNPNASKDELTAEIGKQIQEFADTVEKI